ncbi:MAG: alpha/beta fold hydrolase [Proteobacteria bacterium]|nr:alpha/beta fold hydrolase [Pseudomonadota bacterium]MBU1741996.1 alpha/beta fold hydrolase [Pseudomonadota bacterium]
MGKHFVLIHGAWHGGWCWEGVKAILERAGHTAQTPTMPGHHPDDDRSAVTYDHYVSAIKSVLDRQSGPVILAGHSSAGHMIQCAAPLAPDKIERLVFVNAFILPPGTSQFDLVPPEVAQGMTAAAQASPDNCVPVDEEFVRGVLMAGVSAEIQDRLVSRLVPQPLALFTTKLDTKAFKGLDVPRTVIFCRDDQSLPPGAYLGMAQALGDYQLLEVDGGHETLFTDPEVVAGALIQATR